MFGKLGLDTGEYEKSLGGAETKTGKFAEKLKSGLKTAAKIGGAALGVAATGITSLTKQSVEAYAEYEQLVGGAQLMFGKAYDFVANKAANAYSTGQWLCNRT